jgi:oxygen-independent coproporphyrinogen-3 oxidase
LVFEATDSDESLSDVLPSMTHVGATPGGLYVHIPFCIHKCDYCDFYSISDLSLKTEFLRALRTEIAAAEPEQLVFDTIYFGGGTPSILDPADVEGILDGIGSTFRLAGPVEVTLEANPGTVDAEGLKRFRKAGVTRLNLGVQSFQEENLRCLGRIHSAGQAREAVAAAHRAGFEEVGLDLIYALPGQTRADWAAELESALAFEPQHIAAYMLTVESGTPLDEARRCGRFRPAAEETAAELFLATSEMLSGRGYRHYEISNFARCAAGGRDPRISRHNSKYWNHAPYLGFGPAAHSFLPPRRFWNHRDVRRYIDDVRAGRRPLAGAETLSVEQQMLEAVLLGMRTAAGIDLDGFKSRFGRDFQRLCGPAAQNLAGCGLLTLDTGRCAPTRQGMLYLNSVVAALTDSPAFMDT